MTLHEHYVFVSCRRFFYPLFSWCFFRKWCPNGAQIPRGHIKGCKEQYLFSCHLITRFSFFVLKILVNGVKLPFLMQGKVAKRYFPFPASPDFVVGVARFVVQHPFTETLKGTLLLKFSAIRFHVLTSFLSKGGSTSPFRVIIQTTFSNAGRKQKFL